MDDRRFDDLTKLVGRRASRRSVIKAAIAGAITSVFGSGIAQAALSPIKTRPNLCIQAGQPCKAPNSDPSRKCCYKCNNVTHKCCENVGYLCKVDGDCCVTASGVQPICRDPQAAGTDRRKACFLPGTLQPGAQCIQGCDCASGNCVNGVCSACPVGQTTCGANCCNANLCQVCVNGVCKSKCGPCQTCNGSGACVDTCTKCQTCNTTTKTCVPKTCGPCQTCNSTTGLCQTTCSTCQRCVNNTCVPRCTLCQDCNPINGQCTAKVCPPCSTCNPATGVCSVPTVCPNCFTCDPGSGQCTVPVTCPNCFTCNPATGQCTTPVICANLCQTCDPATGQCASKVCPPCEVCDEATGVCESPCDICEVCDPYSGLCEPKCLDLCAPCDPYTGICEPELCPPCWDCNPNTGLCEPTCGACEFCDEILDVCVSECSACQDCDEYFGSCFNNCPECQLCDEYSGTCLDISGIPCGLGGTCCFGECCPVGCGCSFPLEACVASGGQACIDHSDCLPGEQCVDDGDGPEGTCARVSCATDPCPTGSICDPIGNLCVALCPICDDLTCGECEVCNEGSGACTPAPNGTDCDGGAGACCGGACCADVHVCGEGTGTCQCSTAGVACTGGGDCCSQFCDDATGQCGCQIFGGNCFADTDCCSGRCHNGVCAGGFAGAPCSGGGDCLSLNCVDATGLCGCKTTGGSCIFDEECCSNATVADACVNGICVCGPAGTDCNPNGNPEGGICCSFFCDDTDPNNPVCG